MTTQLERPRRTPAWIAGIFLCTVAALGAVAIVRSIPASYANIPNEGATSTSGSIAGVTNDARTKDARAASGAPQSAIDGPIRLRCPECGVIESIRQVEPPGKAYEITVRLRDGRTTIFNEATPRNWRTGNKVVVISGLKAVSN